MWNTDTLSFTGADSGTEEGRRNCGDGALASVYGGFLRFRGECKESTTPSLVAKIHLLDSFRNHRR